MPSLEIKNIPDFYPEAMAEYNRLVNVGDPQKDKNGKVVVDKKTGQPVMVKLNPAKTPWVTWAAAYSKANPGWLASVNNEFSAKMRDDVNFRLERFKFTKDNLAEIETYFDEAVADYESKKANRLIKDKTFLDYAKRMSADPAWLATINAQYSNLVKNEIDDSKRELQKDPAFAKLSPELQTNLAARIVTGGIPDAEAFVRRDPTLAAMPEIQAWADRATGVQSSADKPYEQQLFETTRKYAEEDIARDAERRKEADAILAGYQPMLDSQKQLISDLTVRQDPGRGALYAGSRTLEQEQDASNQAISQQLTGLGSQVAARSGAIGSELADRQAALNQQVATLGQGLAQLSEEQKAALSTEVATKRGELERELSTRATAVTEQDAARRAAIQEELSTLTGALDTRQAARKGALEQELASLSQGITDQDAARRAALEQELSTLTGALNTRQAARKSALEQELASLGQGITDRENARRAAVEQELSTLTGALDTRQAARRSALEQELSTLNQGISEQDVSRRSALEAQLGELNAAQDLVDQSRMEGARMQGTAINLGAQSEQDRIRAQMASQGFVGGSTGSDMAMGRALIQARQGAAQAVSDAGLTNALARQDISRYGADTRFGIADTTTNLRLENTRYGAGQAREIGDETATMGYNLAGYGAQQNRAVTDEATGLRYDLTKYGSGAAREIGDETATMGYDLAGYGADQQRTLADQTTGLRYDLTKYGSGAAREIGDETATMGYGLAEQTAGRNLALSDQTAGLRYDLANYGAGQTRELGDYGATQTRTLDNTAAESRYKLTDFGAGQQRQLGDYGAEQRRNLTNFSADETRGIQDAGTQRNLDYFDRDTQRRIAGLSLPAAAINQDLQIRNTADNYAQAGLNRAQGNLNFFSMTPTQAPNAITSQFQTSTYQPNTIMGDSQQNIGASIATTGTQVGLAQLYKSTPANPPATKQPGVGSQPLTLNFTGTGNTRALA